VGRGRHNIRQTREVRDPTNLIEQLPIFKTLLECNDVNGFALVEHFGHRIKDGLMPKIIKNVRAGFELGKALAHAFVRGKKNATEDALFGIN
jgi:hypothetical protein